MCVQMLSKRELLFEGVEDIFLQELEEQPEVIIEEQPREINYLIRVLDFIMLSLPYVFMIRSSFIYVDTYTEAFFLIMNTLIYGMIITINQLHNKKTEKYWVFVLFTGLVLHTKYFILIFIVPELINYQFNEKNKVINALIDTHGLLVGTNIYWTFITWVWFVIYSIFTNNHSGFSIHYIP